MFKKDRACWYQRQWLLAAIVIGAVFSAYTACQANSNNKGGKPEEFHTDAAIQELLLNFDNKESGAKKQTLNKFLSSAADRKAKQKAAYIMARLLMKGGSSAELKEALPLFEEAALNPLLFERSQWHIVDAANTLGDENQVRTSLNNLLAKTKDPVQKAHIAYALAQSYTRSNEADKAAEQFKNVLSLGPDSQWALGARYYSGQSALQNKNNEEALKLWREYLQKSPDGGRFTHDIVSALLKNTTFNLTPADHFLIANASFANGECARAVQEWSASGTDLDKLWYKEGNALLRMGRGKEGKEMLLAGMKKHPKDGEVVEAAKTLARIGTRAEAIEVWNTVLENCPDFADAALYNLATRQAEPEDALELYRKLVDTYPDSEYAPEASWWLSFDKIKAGMYTDALKQIKIAAPKYEKARSGSRFSFWIGKLEEELKHTDAARAAYQETIAKFANNYYGYRAQARLNALAGKTDPGWTTEPNKHLEEYSKLQSHGKWTWPTPPLLVSYQEIAKTTSPTVACLAELHQWDECLELLAPDKMPEFRSVCLGKLNLALQAINNLSSSLHGKPDHRLQWQLVYPLLHADIIKSEAQAKGVDPFLAHALIREESRYNVQAVSGSNALGLMQLLPSTAMGVAKRLGVKVKSHEDIHKPENNLKFGIDYLSYTLGRFKGNAMLAVASYNGGPNAVASWTHKYSMDDPDLFVENVPFKETRDYIRKVFGSYWSYESIYCKKQ